MIGIKDLECILRLQTVRRTIIARPGTIALLLAVAFFALFYATDEIVYAIQLISFSAGERAADIYGECVICLHWRM